MSGRNRTVAARKVTPVAMLPRSAGEASRSVREGSGPRDGARALAVCSQLSRPPVRARVLPGLSDADVASGDIEPPVVYDYDLPGGTGHGGFDFPLGSVEEAPKLQSYLDTTRDADGLCPRGRR